MIMKKVLFSLSLSLILFSCKLENNPIKGSECSENQKIEIINSILNVQNINSYLHLELTERHPIKLIKSDFTENLESFNFHNIGKVQIVDSIPWKETNLTLKILIDSCTQKTGKFIFYSPIENAEVNGTITQKDSIWEIEVLHDIEF